MIIRVLRRCWIAKPRGEEGMMKGDGCGLWRDSLQIRHKRLLRCVVTCISAVNLCAALSAQTIAPPAHLGAKDPKLCSVLRDLRGVKTASVPSMILLNREHSIGS